MLAAVAVQFLYVGVATLRVAGEKQPLPSPMSGTCNLETRHSFLTGSEVGMPIFPAAFLVGGTSEKAILRSAYPSQTKLLNPDAAGGR